MTNKIIIRPSVSADAIGKLTHAMECELWPDAAVSLDEVRFTNAAREMLHGDRGLWAFVACQPDGQVIGMLTVNECAALYAGGVFGEIAEFYVAPGTPPGRHRHIQNFAESNPIRTNVQSVGQSGR